MHNLSYICAYCGDEQNSRIDIDGQDCNVCENGYYINVEEDEDGKDNPNERDGYDPD